MKPLRIRLEEFRVKYQIAWHILEQDYCLAPLLKAITEIADLNDHLIFKGGTALKKCYFTDYRFSQDLDFTALEGLKTNIELDQLIKVVCKNTEKYLSQYCNNIKVSFERYQEKSKHPANQDAFSILVQFPWQNNPLTRIMIEITREEQIFCAPRLQVIHHEYGEPIKMLNHDLSTRRNYH